METNVDKKQTELDSTVEKEVSTLAKDNVQLSAESETSVEKNKNESEDKRLSSRDIIAYLVEKYPNCFSLTGAVKPLKIGIFQDLAEKLADDEVVSKTRLRQALRHYTSSWRYLKAIKLGAERVDIDGNKSAEIDQEQADYASKTLKESQAKVNQRKAKATPAKADKKVDAADKSKSKNKQQDKFNKVKSSKPSKRTVKKPAVVLKPITSNNISVGKLVKVQLGQSSMDATITETSGNDVSVQLSSGMVIKTQISNIFTE